METELAIRLGRTFTSVLVLAGACRGPAPAPRVRRASAPPIAPAAFTIDTLDDLLNTPDAPAVAPAATPVETFRRTVRDRLTRPEFYDAFVPTMLTFLDVHQSYRPIFLNDVLTRGAGRGGQTYFYLDRIGDCGGRDLVRIEPWWALGTEVSICAGSVRADVTRTADGAFCDATAHPLPECGCGANLLLCAPTPAWRPAGAQQAREELHRTVRHIVVDKLPYSSILTMRDTVRSSYGDFWYARSAFLQGRPLALPRLAGDDLTPLPGVLTDYALRPRGPEHAGGVLTTPVFLFADGSRRVAVQNLWSDFLCVDWSTTEIAPHTLVALATETNDIRVELNQKLVETPGCRDCHTRLEYPVHALDEFSNYFHGTRYQHRASPDTVKLYVNGASDLRASFDATAGALGAGIAAQPEFHGCAVDKVIEFAYQGFRAPELVRARLVAEFARGEDLGRLIEDALVARAFGARALASEAGR